MNKKLIILTALITMSVYAGQSANDVASNTASWLSKCAVNQYHHRLLIWQLRRTSGRMVAYFEHDEVIVISIVNGERLGEISLSSVNGGRPGEVSLSRLFSREDIVRLASQNFPGRAYNILGGLCLNISDDSWEKARSAARENDGGLDEEDITALLRENNLAIYSQFKGYHSKFRRTQIMDTILSIDFLVSVLFAGAMAYHTLKATTRFLPDEQYNQHEFLIQRTILYYSITCIQRTILYYFITYISTLLPESSLLAVRDRYIKEQYPFLFQTQEN